MRVLRGRGNWPRGAGRRGNGVMALRRLAGAAGPSGPGAPWAMISPGNFTADGGGIDNGNVAEDSGSMALNNTFAITGTIYLGQTFGNTVSAAGTTPSGSTATSPTSIATVYVSG